jgi:alpha/beta superfamily hydrolase
MGEALDYSYHSGAENNHYVLIIGHGLDGNKDTPLILELSNKVSSEGMSVLRFSFSGNGNSQGKYTESTISKGIIDLQAVITRVCEQGGRPIYLGHGSGATVGTLVGAKDSRIQLLVSLAGLAETKKFCMNIPNPESVDDNSQLSENLKEDLKKIKSVYSLSASIMIPWLLIHGSEDKIVPVTDSSSLIPNFEETRDLVELPNADHFFSGESVAQVSGIIIDWIGKRIQPC